MYRPETMTDINAQYMFKISLFIHMFFSGFSYSSVLLTVIFLYAQIIFYQYETEITRTFQRTFHGALFAPFTDRVKAHVSDNELSDNESDLDSNDEVQQATAPEIAAGRIQTRWRKFRSSRPPGWGTDEEAREKATASLIALNVATIRAQHQQRRRRPGGTLTEVPAVSAEELREETWRMKELLQSPRSRRSSSLE